MAVNDRSTDHTGEILADLAALKPDIQASRGGGATRPLVG